MDCQQDETDDDDSDLDPRIQVELEKLNSATDEINKLEMELDEANTTFRMLMNDSMRRLKLAGRQLGGSIDRARPYYEAVEVAKRAQLECQRAAVQFQRASGIHQAARETVTLAEERFLSKQHEWQFDNTWQEMLNHATNKVVDAELQKAESGREHQRRATLFNAAEQKVQLLETHLKRSIAKARPYFEEKAMCQGQLDTQKTRIDEIQTAVNQAKAEYASSLRRLEGISEEIHRRRGHMCGSKLSPHGPREPGVGAELEPVMPMEFAHDSPKNETARSIQPCEHDVLDVAGNDDKSQRGGGEGESREMRRLSDLERDLDLHSLGGASSTAVSEGDELDDSEEVLEEDVEELRERVRELSVRAAEGVGAGEGGKAGWESQLSTAISRLDAVLLMKECEQQLRESTSFVTDPRAQAGRANLPNTAARSNVLPDEASQSIMGHLLKSVAYIETFDLKTTLYCNCSDRLSVICQ